MCGILGIVSKRHPVEEHLLTQMRDAMVHRGPDAGGNWISHDRTVGLAHRRLAIIDLSPGGAQPMCDPSGSIIVSFNGEIYNFKELRQQLRALGHSFLTSSDTEVLIEAYREWGVDCLLRLNGMFAFGLYDSQHGTLFLARDRAGEKPLFYHLTEGRFVFASELKALMADPNLTRRLDPEALDCFLAYGYVPGEQCILRGVHKLRPAHAMTYDCVAGHLRQWKYWSLPDFAPASPGRSSSELTDELDRLLEDSVRRRLVADVPVGVLLSGGIDSSLITAMAARASSQPVSTFTISFPGHGPFDESSYARSVANYYGTKHTELQAEDASIELLPAMARQFDEPLADSSLIPTFLVSRLVRNYATVALGGDGGDELFAGYLHYNTIASQEAQRKHLPNSLLPLLGAAATYLLPPGLYGRNYIMQLSAVLPDRVAQVNSYFDPFLRRCLQAPELRAALEGAPPAEQVRSALFARGSTFLRNCTAIDFLTYLPDDILTKVDRASMMTSLEVRAPWLDPELIAFAFQQLPDHLRGTTNGRKLLPKLLAKRLLPPETDLHRKQGFSIPLVHWLKGQWGTYFKMVLSDLDPQLFNHEVVTNLFSGLRSHRSNAHRLFALTLFTLWQKEYKIRL